MDTVAHCVVNLAAIEREDRPRAQAAVLAGALLPDAPMFLFYFVEKVMRGTSESVIWTTAYWRPEWQNAIDLFNSIPLIALGIVLSIVARARIALLLCLSMLLHTALDLPLHHDDGHRHFYPFSDWRFESPLSYWDGHHHADVVSVGIFLLVGAAGLLLWRTASRPTTRWIVGGLAGAYAVFFVYARWMWA